jgi:anti-sigma factor RsiW
VTLHQASRHGFDVVLWRAGGVSYALVSDVAPKELAALASTMASTIASARAR